MCSFRFHADSSPGLITNKNNQSENEVYPSEEQDTIGAKYYLSTGKELPFCRKYNKIQRYLNQLNLRRLLYCYTLYIINNLLQEYTRLINYIFYRKTNVRSVFKNPFLFTSILKNVLCYIYLKLLFQTF